MEGLAELISDLTFGNDIILQRDIIVYLGGIVIKDYAIMDGTATTGGCVELAETAMQRIRRSFPELDVVLGRGTEPDYFMAPYSAHAYLLVDEDNALTAQNPTIVDPSFGKVMPFAGSGYGMRHPPARVKTMKPPHNDLVMPFGTFPLMIDDNGNMLHMRISADADFFMKIRPRGGELIQYDIFDNKLMDLLEGSKRALRFVHKLRETAREYM